MTKYHWNRFAAAFAGMATACMLAAPVAASPNNGATQVEVEAPPPTERISYSDLDLTSAAGRVQLKKRIREAVGHVCPAPSRVSAEVNMLSRNCRDTALFDAFRQMDRAIAGSDTNPTIATLLVVGASK